LLITVFPNLVNSKIFLRMRKISNKLFEVIKSLIIAKKNTSNSGINATSLMYVSSKLCSIVDIITLLDEIKY
jgi:hypothetical protein